MSRSGTWNSWWAFHWIQLRAAAVQCPWAEAKGTLPKVPMPWHPPVLVIAVRDEWWEDWESGTTHSGMSRVFYLPQHRTLSTCWFSADERQYWKLLGSLSGVWTPAFSAAGRHSTTWPLCCLWRRYSDKDILLIQWQFKTSCSLTTGNKNFGELST